LSTKFFIPYVYFQSIEFVHYSQISDSEKICVILWLSVTFILQKYFKTYRKERKFLDRNEMEKIYDTYKNTVYRTAYACCKNKSDAEDIMQETFIKRFTSELMFSDEKSEKAWLIKVTVNKCRDMFRSLRYKIMLNSVPVEETEIPCENQEESKVYTAVMELPQKYRIVIHLYYYEGYSVKEIGRITGRNESAVQTQLYRARNILKKSLGEEMCL